MPLKIKKTVQQMVDEANGQIETLPLADAMKVHGQPGVTFIDIRDPRELWRDGTIPGAINVTRGMLEMWIDPESPRIISRLATSSSSSAPAPGGRRSPPRRRRTWA